MRNLVFSLLTIVALLASCNTHQNGVKDMDPAKKIQKTSPKKLKLLQPSDKSYINPQLPLKVEFTNSSETEIDSILIQADNNPLAKLSSGRLSAEIDISRFNPGELRLLCKVYFADSSNENHISRLRIVSDIEPVHYSYRVINTYPHDIKSYTQGFEFVDGYFYEGTGNYGESSVRKVDYKTGEILKFRNLSSEFFGEGITILADKIYQVTYRKQVGFVYDKRSFEPIRKIFYQNKEGWGLCNDGKNILMSDGTHLIYFMDTTYFSVERKIEVFDNEKEVTQLNELELINGVLYANRYTTHEIVMIDPETGKITGKIDMSGILDEKDRHPRIDYFNGIAYDKENDRIFVTGKYWNKVYEVEFIRN